MIGASSLTWLPSQCDSRVGAVRCQVIRRPRRNIFNEQFGINGDGGRFIRGRALIDAPIGFINAFQGEIGAFERHTAEGQLSAVFASPLNHRTIRAVRISCIAVHDHGVTEFVHIN